MATKKTAPGEDTAPPAPVPAAPDLPLPTTGGCYTRNPDGSLTADAPDEAAPAQE